MSPSQKKRKCISICLVFLMLPQSPVLAFQTPRQPSCRSCSSVSSLPPFYHQTVQEMKARPSTALNMFMGSDGGLLGIGTPELVTILLVGYFVLGPSDLYKIVKEVGKFIQNIRTFSTDLTSTFESSMESQLQLQDIRKAQQELTDAFSFRRSINVNEEAEAFSNEAVESVAPAAAAASVASASPSQIGSKKIRRRVKKRVPPPTTVPDLEMPTSPTIEDQSSSISALEAAEIEKEFEKYTRDVVDDYISPRSTVEQGDDWLKEPDSVATSRFQQQLSGNWNEQILENEDKLSPIATVMNKIALLEKEKKAAMTRLEDEFAQRKALEDRYYREQRALLEEASFQIQDELILGPKSGKS